MSVLKHYGLILIGSLGSCLAWLFGGWTQGMIVLMIFMATDYVTGLMVAGLFNNSPKSPTGALSSKAGYQGLARKFMILVFIMIGALFDRSMSVDFAKNAVILSFMANELLSIIENAGLMGVPIPSVLKKAIEILKDRETEATAHD